MTTKKTRTPITTTGAYDDAARLMFSHAEALRIARDVAQYECRSESKALADGALTLPAMRPFAARLHFTRSMEAISTELAALRARFDRGRTEPGDTGTLSGSVLDTLASYFSCVAEDGVWSAETFSGLRANLERELRLGVTEEELQQLKDHGDDAGATPAELRTSTQAELMRAQGFPVSPRDPHWAVDPKLNASLVGEFNAEEFVKALPRLGEWSAGVTRQGTIEWTRRGFETTVYATPEWSDASGVEVEVVRDAGVVAAVSKKWPSRSIQGYLAIVRPFLTDADNYEMPGDIFTRVCRVMQDADELGGTSDLPDYVELMERIAAEANRRADNARANMRGPWSMQYKVKGDPTHTIAMRTVEAADLEEAHDAMLATFTNDERPLIMITKAVRQ